MDQNYDGAIDKKELFDAFKKIRQNQHISELSPNQFFNQPLNNFHPPNYPQHSNHPRMEKNFFPQPNYNYQHPNYFPQPNYQHFPHPYYPQQPNHFYQPNSH